MKIILLIIAIAIQILLWVAVYEGIKITKLKLHYLLILFTIFIPYLGALIMIAALTNYREESYRKENKSNVQSHNQD